MTEFYIHIENGKLLTRAVLKNRLQELEDGQYRMTIEKARRRSLSQNAYYHAVVCEIVKDCLRDRGFNEVRTAEQAHEILKFRFLKMNVISEQGEVMEVIKETKKLSTKEFSDYIEEIAQWVAEEFGVAIPAPGTQAKIINL